MAYENLIEKVLAERDFPRNFVEEVLEANSFDDLLDEDEETLIEEALRLLDTVAAYRATDMQQRLDPDGDED